ncbi:FK506-binding protein 1, putative [Eimeria brunetti]|uniref:peptidylprolyl isomerase n=1 Tax=Eimeria brunetti TaxID=51314 RepID=U6LT86_9EIME|nr:FK506-binding protein 1, putative [Eimeria brunetti]
MEDKWQEQNPRRRADVRREAAPPASESPEQSEEFKGLTTGNRTKFYSIPCLLIFLIGGLLLLAYFWRPQSASSFPIGIQELFARSAQLVFPNPPNTHTGSAQSPEVTMAPLTELRTSVVKPGSGPTVAKGQRVTVHATGSVLHADGTTKKFWSTKDPGQQPFTWQAGLGQVIAGWDQGVLGMNLGETRMIYIPAKMGYGQNGFPSWGIPPNADLQFEIECLNIQ